jgi:Xaa-Pro dipeptidase
LYQQRITKLQDMMTAQAIDCFILTRHVDLFYYTGSMQAGYLLIPARGAPLYYVRRSVTRAMEETDIQVEPLDSLKTWGNRISQAFPVLSEDCNIALTFDTLPVELYERFQLVLPKAKWVNGTSIVRTLRMVKEESELACMRRAALLVDMALRQTVPKIHAGMKEIELLAEIEYVMRKQGHLGTMRVRAMNMEMVTGIAASGANAAKPSAFDGPAGGAGIHPAFPKGAGLDTLKNGEPILLDIGCNVDGYLIDQTRTAVIGDLAEDLTCAYQTSELILRAIEQRLRPGTICEDLYIMSLEMAERAGLSEHYMGYKSNAVKFVGHGFGLEIDEWPILARGFRTSLEPGMVIAIEPKFTFPDRGVVGIENSYVITNDGFEKLTVSAEGIWQLRSK